MFIISLFKYVDWKRMERRKPHFETKAHGWPPLGPFFTAQIILTKNPKPRRQARRSMQEFPSRFTH